MKWSAIALNDKEVVRDKMEIETTTFFEKIKRNIEIILIIILQVWSLQIV